MTGLLLMAAAIIIIVCATGQVSLLLLAVAIQTAGSHIAFGYLYQQALNVCYRGRMMLYLSLFSLAGALGEEGALAVYWITGNAHFTLLLILLLLLLGVVILRLCCYAADIALSIRLNDANHRCVVTGAAT